MRATLLEPYPSVVVLPEDLHGWCDEPERMGLGLLMARLRPVIVVEVGTWLGKSARHIATLLPPGGRLFCVDPWGLAPIKEACDGMSAADLERLPTLYQQFLSNVIHWGLADRIVPVRAASVEAAGFLAVRPALVYVDGDHHSAAVTADLLAWHARLAPGGIICGGDFNWASVEVGVRAAMEKLQISPARLTTSEVEPRQFWWIEP